jgi:hypothetical protein
MRFATPLRRPSVVRLLGIICQRGPYKELYAEVHGIEDAIVMDHIVPILNCTFLPQNQNETRRVGLLIYHSSIAERVCSCTRAGVSLLQMRRTYRRRGKKIWFGSLHNYSYMRLLEQARGFKKYFVVQHTSKLLSSEPECTWG